jgi:hypothetical protein
MTTYIFQVKQKPIPNTHEHSYEAEYVATGDVFPLPPGGNGEYVRSYPEITTYLKDKHGVQADVTYTPRLGDKAEPDSTSAEKLTYKRNGHEVIVNEIVRVAFEATFYSPKQSGS